MVVTKCDRCGTIYDIKKCSFDNNTYAGTIEFKENLSFACATEHFYDLCPTCTKEFLKWMEKEGAKTNE